MFNGDDCSVCAESLCFKDGGSKEFTALTYRITKVHSMNPVESEEEFTTGTIIEIFGREVYNNVD